MAWPAPFVDVSISVEYARQQRLCRTTILVTNPGHKLLPRRLRHPGKETDAFVRHSAHDDRHVVVFACLENQARGLGQDPPVHHDARARRRRQDILGRQVAEGDQDVYGFAIDSKIPSYGETEIVTGLVAGVRSVRSSEDDRPESNRPSARSLCERDPAASGDAIK